MKYFTLFFLFFVTIIHAQVGIGNTDPEGVLHIDSSNAGMVIPRVASTSAVVNPQTGAIAEGTMVYVADEICFKIYADGSWTDVTRCFTPSTQFADFTFNVVNSYFGDTPFGGTSVGFTGFTVPPSSTIRITVNVASTGPYEITGTDSTSGLTYSASGEFTITGNGQQLTLVPDDTTPLTEGVIGEVTITLNGTNASNTIDITPQIDVISIPTDQTEIIDIGIDIDNADGDNDATTGTFEQVWMDRNLGAQRAATSVFDPFGSGSLFQWGRLSDGHEFIVVNGVQNQQKAVFFGATTTLSTTPIPPTSQFIRTQNNWITPADNTLWQGVDGINNPCPSGYRVPTLTEFDAMISALGIENQTDAVNSILRFPSAGRIRTTNGLAQSGGEGLYWTSTVNNNNASFDVRFLSTNVGSGSRNKGTAESVRCIKQQ